MKTLKELADEKGYEIRHHKTQLKKDESIKNVVTPFNFSNENGGTIDAFIYYNIFYLYKLN